MRLYVMRHGPAEDRSLSGRDFDRTLTPAGRAVVRRIAGAFQALRGEARGGAPAALRILTSPRARAAETAAIVREAILPAPTLEVRDELGGEAPIPHALVVEAAAVGGDTLLVGHQPVVEELVRGLVRGPLALAGFRAATLVGLEPTEEASVWTLAALLDPQALQD